MLPWLQVKLGMKLAKSEAQIELIRQSSLLVGRVHGEVSKMIKPGVRLMDIDKFAEQFIRDNGGKPAFKGYGDPSNPFPNALCMSLNDVVVHGIPNEYELKEGDLLSVDCGVEMKGYFGDSAYTFGVGQVSQEAKQLMKITLECLQLGIDNAVFGKRVGDIGYAIQQHAEKNGYGVVRQLTGHGVGKALHEKPDVPNFGKRSDGKRLEEGMVIAIEPMITQFSKEIYESEDGWGILTSDKGLAAHYEHTVVVRRGKAEILSTFDYIQTNA